jgi:hypothetical protein
MTWLNSIPRASFRGIQFCIELDGFVPNIALVCYQDVTRNLPLLNIGSPKASVFFLKLRARVLDLVQLSLARPWLDIMADWGESESPRMEQTIAGMEWVQQIFLMIRVTA